MEHASLTVLQSGIVLDKSKMPSDATELSILLAGAYGSGKTVVIVPNATSFFSSANLIKCLENGDASWELIVEKYELSVSRDDLAIIQRSVEIRKEIMAKLKPIYQFADVPDNWKIARNLQVGTGMVRRAYVNKEGDNTEYDLSLKTLKNIWIKAGPYWNSGTALSLSGGSISVNYSSRSVLIKPNSITIGCQIVRRYELEQLALQQNWDFPST